jgi:hypothetical protein
LKGPGLGKMSCPVDPEAQVDTPHELNQHGGQSDADKAQGRQAQTAVDEPGVQNDVHQETGDQEISERPGLTQGIQNGIEHVDEHEKNGAQENGVHVSDGHSEVLTGCAQDTE